MKESLYRKTVRAVVGSKFTAAYVDVVFRIIITELLLWAFVWKAGSALDLQGWPVADFVVPCIVSGCCQLFVRDILSGLVGKHTWECARRVQRSVKKYWSSEAAWAGVKTALGFAAAAVTIAASRAGFLEPQLVEKGAWQIMLTTVAVDVTRNPNHPLRKCVGEPAIRSVCAIFHGVCAIFHGVCAIFRRCFACLPTLHAYSPSSSFSTSSSSSSSSSPSSSPSSSSSSSSSLGVLQFASFFGGWPFYHRARNAFANLKQRVLVRPVQHARHQTKPRVTITKAHVQMPLSH